MKLKLWTYIDIESFAEYAGKTYTQAQKFIQADMRAEEWFYTMDQVRSAIAEMKEEFKEDTHY